MAFVIVYLLVSFAAMIDPGAVMLTIGKGATVNVVGLRIQNQ